MPIFFLTMINVNICVPLKDCFCVCLRLREEVEGKREKTQPAHQEEGLQRQGLLLPRQGRDQVDERHKGAQPHV